MSFKVYASLDNESRFFGKEIVGLFANRLGRSGSAVVLAIVTTTFPSLNSRAPFLLLGLSLLWLLACYRVVGHLRNVKTKVKVG